MGILQKATTIILVVFVGLALAVDRPSLAETEQQIIAAILKDYNKDISPLNGTDSTDNVTVNLYIRSIGISTEDKQTVPTMNVQLTFRQQWFDPRLRHPQNLKRVELQYVTLRGSGRVWKPDLFFSNEITSHTHENLVPNEYLRIFQNGEVLFSIRISLKLSCPMILRNFPFDTQTCSMRMASYSRTTDFLRFVWKEADPVQVTSDLHMPDLSLVQFHTDYCDSQTNTGTYSCLRVDLTLKRAFKYYLIHVFIPFLNLIICSWLSFWLNVDTRATPRAIVTLFTHFMSFGLCFLVKADVAHYSYTTAMDVWTGTCLTFTFSSLIVFLVVCYLSHKESARGITDTTTTSGTKGFILRRFWSSAHRNADKVDALALVIYPIAFVVFCICYFCKYAIPRDCDSDIRLC